MQLQILYKSVKSNTKDPLCPADARQLPPKGKGGIAKQ